MTTQNKSSIEKYKALKEIISLRDSDSPATEAYRSLRTNIIYKNFDKPIQVVNITSANPAEGKSTTALNLAVVYAQLGKKVLLIDLDFRIPSIHKKLRIRNTVGVTDLLNRTATLGETIRKIIPNFDVITSGTKIIYHSELIQSQALKNLVERLRDDYDFIVLDSPPIGLVADGIIISKITDGTILVCETGANDRKTLLKMKHQFEEVDSQVLGIVITKVDQRKHYGKYGYRYSNDKVKKKSFFGKKK